MGGIDSKRYNVYGQYGLIEKRKTEMLIMRYGSIYLVVKDFAKSLAFYEKNFDMQLVYIFDIFLNVPVFS